MPRTEGLTPAHLSKSYLEMKEKKIRTVSTRTIHEFPLRIPAKRLA